MTTWSIETVRKVQRLGISLMAPTLVADANTEWQEHVRREMARQIVDAARTLAVEVHPDDVVAEVRDSPADRHERQRTHEIKIEGRWAPGWSTPNHRLSAELLGGYYDGKVIPLWSDELERVTLPAEHAPERVLAEVEERRTIPRALGETYELHGWNEGERRWVLAWRAG